MVRAFCNITLRIQQIRYRYHMNTLTHKIEHKTLFTHRLSVNASERASELHVHVVVCDIHNFTYATQHGSLISSLTMTQATAFYSLWLFGFSIWRSIDELHPFTKTSKSTLRLKAGSTTLRCGEKHI